MPNISIIILTYNQEAFIEKAIRGVFMQNFRGKIQLIISNDASRDRTHEIINNLLQQAPENIEIQYTLHPKNIGATPNMYDALKKVKGKYLALCEGDDYWTDKHKLQKQYDFLSQNPDYSLCFHQAINVSPYPEIHGTPFSLVDNRDYTPEEIYRHWVVHTATVMLRAETLKSDAFLKTMKDPTLLYFDTILFLAASTVGKMRGLSDAMSAYRRHDAGLSFGAVNLKRDLKHNHLDRIIELYYGGKIREHARWQIFKRSYEDFSLALKKKDFLLSFSFLKWILKYYKNLIIFIIKQIKK